MATKLYLNYIRSADVENVQDIYQIQVYTDKWLLVEAHVDGSRRKYKFDFLDASPTQGSVQTPHLFQDICYRYMIDPDGTVHLWFAVGVPAGTDIPVPDYQEITFTSQVEVFRASGVVRDRNASNYRTAMSWVPGTPTTAEKKASAIAAIKRWREQIKAWLRESPQYGDLVPNIVTHLGYWLRSADYTLSMLYEDTDGGVSTAMSWEVLEAVIEAMILGPTSLDPDGDGSYEALFFQRLLLATASFPTGPDFGALWVNWWELDNNSVVGDVERVSNMITDVLADAYSGTRRMGSLTPSYNPLNEYWSSS